MMSFTTPLSVAVVGLGRAGRARVRTLEAHPRARLGAVVRSAPGPGETSFAALLADAGIDAAIVCTPNRLHAGQARALLAAGKHVAVEYPLAPTVAEARELFALARAHERVLHVEHIELLTAGHAARRAAVARLGALRSGEVRFTSGNPGWMGDPARAGSPAFMAEARLHAIVDLFGPAELLAARLEPAGGGTRLELRLGFRGGGELGLVEQRAPGLPRETAWRVACERGPLPEPDENGGGDLFRLDLDHFLAAIEHGSPLYVGEPRLIEVLELVEAIERRTERP